jgi:Spy/CpxP family protein refolding chaperone
MGFWRAMAAGMVLGCCGLATAQQGDAPPLKGPDVKENRIPGVDEGFSGQRRGEPRMGGGPVPMRVFVEALDGLRGETAPVDLRLSADQEGKLRTLEQEFRDAARKFEERARRDMRERMQNGEGMDGPDRPALRERLEAFRREGPNMIEWQTKAYAVLNEGQRKFVAERLDGARKELEARRAHEYMERRLRERGQGAGPAPAASADRPGAEGPGRERVRRIFELMQRLPPEERERMLERIERALEQRLGEDGERKPPPSMKDVDVPPMTPPPGESGPNTPGRNPPR